MGVGNILDIILCNDQSAIDIERITNPLSTSDHCIVDFSLHFPQLSFHPDRSRTTDNDRSVQNFDCTTNNPSLSIDDCCEISDNKLPMYDWANGNYDAINELLNTLDWHQLFGYYFDVESI